jgi:hypothetical protein
LSTARYIVSKRKIPRNRKVSGVFLLPGNIKIMKNNSILKYGYLMKSLLLNEEEPIYGKYGMLRKQFLKEHRSAKYQYLLLTGKLTEHLNQIDQEARKQVEILMEQMVKKQGATEELKAQDQMKWVRLMINIKSSAEEIVVKNTIYM